MVSGLLDKCNVDHLHYEAAYSEDLYCCRCRCMTTEKRSILPGMDFISYCNVNGLNWGFFYDCDTMEIFGCHPLYDHNNAFDPVYMHDKDAAYQFCGKSIREAAKTAMENVDFHFTQEITREDFLTDRQYASFISRAEELGISR